MTPTEAMSLWLANDQGWYTLRAAIIDETDELQDAIDRLREEIEELNPCSDRCDAFADMMNHALAQVDWKSLILEEDTAIAKWSYTELEDAIKQYRLHPANEALHDRLRHYLAQKVELAYNRSEKDFWYRRDGWVVRIVFATAALPVFFCNTRRYATLDQAIDAATRFFGTARRLESEIEA